VSELGPNYEAWRQNVVENIPPELLASEEDLRRGWERLQETLENIERTGNVSGISHSIAADAQLAFDDEEGG
jgi:hypothetical protein